MGYYVSVYLCVENVQMDEWLPFSFVAASSFLRSQRDVISFSSVASLFMSCQYCEP